MFRKSKDTEMVNDLKMILVRQENILDEISTLRVQIGDLQANSTKSKGIVSSLKEVEFKVFSQFGDDGIIQYLVNNIDIPVKTFIEFGVQDYLESNTRFLLINNNWTGLIIDGSEEDMDRLKNREMYWRYNLKAVAKFINRQNINSIFKENGFNGEIGILSIDIDGNDYWIWEAIEVVNPVIVIIEYNSVFGKDYAISVPYDENFYRTKAHFSNLYWGASLKALIHLANTKGYLFVGSNSAGNNAYFVRTDKIGMIKPLDIEQGYVSSKFRESRDKDGRLTFISGEDRLRAIEECEVFNFENNRIVKIKDLRY